MTSARLRPGARCRGDRLVLVRVESAKRWFGSMRSHRVQNLPANVVRPTRPMATVTRPIYPTVRRLFWIWICLRRRIRREGDRVASDQCRTSSLKGPTRIGFKARCSQPDAIWPMNDVHAEHVPWASSAVPGGTSFQKDCLPFLQHAGFFGRAQADQAVDGIGGPVR